MFKELFETFKSNPGLAIGSVLGAAGAAAAGMMVLPAGMVGIVGALLLGVAGLIGGGLAGNAVSARIDESKPSSAGLQPVAQAAPIAPAAPASVEFRPSRAMADKAIAAFRQQFPEYASKIPPMAGSLATLAKLKLEGMADAEGKYLAVTRVTPTIPLLPQPAPELTVTDVRLPLKAGAIDLENPETAVALEKIASQAVHRFVPAGNRERAGAVVAQAMQNGLNAPATTANPPAGGPVRSLEEILAGAAQGQPVAGSPSVALNVPAPPGRGASR